MTVWLVDEFGLGGIARYTVDVANLVRAFAPVRVATTDGGPASGLEAALAETWFFVGAGGPVDKIGAAIRGWATAMQRVRRGDVVWFPLGIRPSFEAVMAASARARGAIVVGTIHNRAPHGRAGLSGGPSAATRLCDVAVTHTAALSRWAGRHGLRAARLPFPRPFGGSPPTAGLDVKSRFGLSSDDRLIAIVGNLYPYKGIDVALDALSHLRRRGMGDGVRMVLAGQWPAGVDLTMEARRRGVEDRVLLLTGYLDDGELCDVIASVDAVALTYHRIDNSGIAALVATIGTPVIASNLSSLRETFGASACYVPPGDSGALADALIDPSLPRVSPRVDGITERAAYRAFLESL